MANTTIGTMIRGYDRLPKKQLKLSEMIIKKTVSNTKFSMSFQRQRSIQCLPFNTGNLPMLNTVIYDHQYRIVKGALDVFVTQDCIRVHQRYISTQ